MKKLIVVIAVTGVFTVMAMAVPSLWRTHADVSVKVLDESGAPLEGAEVNIGFRDMHAKGPGKGWGIGRVDYHPAKGKTGPDGMFSASDNTSPNVVVTVTKLGYYESRAGVFNEKTETAHKGVLNITLRKIKNPVPMYAKRTEAMKIPAFEQPVGYDLEIGDWVAPYGKGEINDFVFTFKSNVNARDDYDCSYVLSFSNPNDGILEYEHPKPDNSSYKWPFTAPENGYEKTLDKFISCKPEEFIKTNLKNNNKAKYIFRVRTQTDKKGNIISAKYGKINGEISFSRNNYVDLSYYYFNPDGTTNLEYDTEKNLFIPEGVEKWKPQYRNFINFGP